MKLILEALHEPAVLLDGEGRITIANRGWLALVESGGAPASAVVGALYPDLGDARAVRRVLVGQEERAEAEHALRCGEDERWYRASVVRLLDDAERGVLVRHAEVTERVRLEREVRHRDAALDALGARGGDIVARFGADLRYIYVNRAASHATGRPREDFIGRTNAELGIPEPLLSQWNGALRQVLSTGQAIRQDWVLDGSEGERVYESLAQPEVDERGERVGVICITRDVTVAREAERELRDLEEWYRMVAEASLDIIWEMDPATGTMRWRGALDGTLGYRADDWGAVVGWWEDRVHPDDRGVVDDFRGALAGTVPMWEGEYRWRRKDGGYGRVTDRCRIVRDDEGRAVRAVGAFRDISREREAEAAVRFHAEVLDQVGEVVMAADPAGRITYWNPAAERIYGWTSSEVLGRPVREVIVADGAPGAVETIVEMLLQGEAWTGEMVVRRRDGAPVPLHVTGSPMRDGEGAIVGLVGIATDLSAHRRMEEDLRQAQKMEAIGQLAGGIAHDFNNILTAIQGNAEMALLDLSPDHPVGEELEAIASSARRAAGLTQQLLAFARRQTSLPRPVDLNREVRSVEGMLERVLEQRVVLRTILDTRPATVVMDPTQLDQILVNLAVNARDAMPDGGVLTITTAAVELPEVFPGFESLVAGGAYIRLQVRDEGTGMEEAVRARAFEPFFTTKETGKGTGLGLSTVYGIVSQAGGHVDLQSTPGEGTVVTILLPRAAGSGGPEPADSPTSLVGTDPVARGAA